jgi:hypothetical protein
MSNNYVLLQQQQHMLIHQQQIPPFTTREYGNLYNFRGKIIDQISDNLLASRPSKFESYYNSNYNSRVIPTHNLDSLDLLLKKKLI